MLCVRAEQNSAGIPIAVMDDAYSKETLALSEEIELYAGMDLYSAERPKIVQVAALPPGASSCMLLWGPHLDTC